MPPEATAAESPQRYTSAKRLLDLVTAIRSTPGGALTEVLPAVFGITPANGTPDALDWMKCQAIVAEMVSAFQRELAEAAISADERALYSKGMHGLLLGLSPTQMARPRVEFDQRFTAVDLNNLQHADLCLRRFVNENAVAVPDFQALISAMTSAQEVLQLSELPSELKDTLIAQLIKIKTAIEQYKFRGMRGVEDALDAFYGSLGRVNEVVDATLDEKSKLTLTTLLQTANALVTLAKGASWVWPHALAAGHIVMKALQS